MIINKYTSLFPLKLKFFQENFKVVCKKQTQTHTEQLSKNRKIAKNLIFQKVLSKMLLYSKSSRCKDSLYMSPQKSMQNKDLLE